MLLAVSTLTAQNIEHKIVGCDTLTYQYTPIDQNCSKTSSSGRLAYKLFAGDPWAIMLLPIYTLETNFGIAFTAKYYKPKFEISPIAIASISGYYNISVSGKNKLYHRHSLDYGAGAKSEPTRLWGLTYDSALNSPHSKYTSKEYSAWVEYSYQPIETVTVGLFADYSYIGARKLDTESTKKLIDTQLTTSTTSFGAHLSYDTRSNTSHTQQQGIYTKIEASYLPKLLSNLSNNLWSLSATFDWYQPLWRGATLTFDLYGKHSSKKTPWLLQCQVGGDSRMRGYYLGRFRGNTLISSQLELRQHIWRGIGITAWGGAGTAFSPNDSFASRKILPTYGGGLRYYHKLFMVRADVGFGRNSYNIILSISEAF